MNNRTVNNQVIESTIEWLEKFVIKHNLCPFAVKPFRDNRIRYVSCPASNEKELADILIDEILLLKDADPNETETTLVIMPFVLTDFLDYNQFLNVVDSIIDNLNVKGDLQVASFHPDYQFADLEKDDVRNYTNRSPYPMFHIIREDSIEKAREMMDTESIPDRNMQLLINIGLEGITIKD
jgi:uncharacterized protein